MADTWKWVDRVLKGPAKYAGPYDLGGFVDQSGEVICWFGDDEQYYPTGGEPPSETNKNLIGASPQMYAALEAVALFVKPTPSNAAAMNAVFQALSCARGES